MKKLSLYLLGSPYIELDGAVVNLNRRKATALMAYLAVTGGRTRESLAALFWPQLDQSRSRAALRRTLASLKKAIGPEHLLIERESLAVCQHEHLRADFQQFEQLLAQCQIHSHQIDQVCQACLSPLTQAVELYRDDFMAGFTLRDSPGFDDWQLFQREALGRQLNGALERLINCLCSAGQYEEAINYTQRWLILEPFHEPAHRQLMQLYAWLDQPTAALRQYQECVDVLESELKMPPQTATTQLYQAIKKNQIPSPQTSPRVWAAPLPLNLPVQPTPFLGRKSELADIARYLSDPDRRLLTIVGPGGIGKTRLALKAAAENAHLFQHGVAHIPLASLNTTDQVVSAAAEALNFTFQSEADSKIQLINYLQERQVLLILDNFEHLLSSTPLLTELLSNTKQLKLLVTSREQLNFRWEWLLEINGLDFPTKVSDLSANAYSAIQLFQQSTQRVQPSFALSENNIRYAAQICRFLEGMPLGIELAANWIQTLTCQEIAQEIEHDLDFLSSTMRDMPERHRSLRTIFDHSWNLLLPKEQKAFRKLGVFKGGFHRVAAEKIAGATLPMLAGWARKSLLRRNPNGRYELQDVLRHYVEQKLTQAPKENSSAHDRHCQYFSNFLHKREPHLKDRRQKQALWEVGEEIENVRAAWQWAVTHQKVNQIDKSLGSLHRFYEMRGWVQEAEEAYRAAVENLGELNDHSAELAHQKDITVARILARWGRFQQLRSYLGGAQQLLDESLHILRRRNARQAMAFPLKELGSVAWKQGDHVQAKQHLDQSLAIYRENGDLWGMAGTLDSLGIAACEERDFVKARKLFQQGYDICQKIGDQWGLAARITHLGIVTEALGQYEDALQFHQRGVAVCRETGHHWELANNLNNLAYTLLTMGEDEKAAGCFQEALEIAQDTQRASTALETLYGMVLILRKQGQDNQAQKLIKQVLGHPAIRWEILNTSDHILAELEVQLCTHALYDPTLYQELVKKILDIKAWGGEHVTPRPLPPDLIYWR